MLSLCFFVFSQEHEEERIKQLIEAKDYKNAIEEISMCINKSSDNDLFAVRAFLYQQTGAYGDAVADYNKCLEDMPDSPDLWNAAGLCYLELKEYDSAIKYFTKAIEKSSELKYGDISVYYHNREIAETECGKKHD